MKSTKKKETLAPAYIISLINVKRYFNNIIYPVTKPELIEFLRYQDAPVELIRILSRLPFAVYASFYEINDALMKRYFVHHENIDKDDSDEAESEFLEPFDDAEEN